MARAGFAADLMGGDVEAGADVGFDGSELGAGLSGGVGLPDFMTDRGLGEFGNRGLIIWGASVAWLFFVWRAVKGY